MFQYVKVLCCAALAAMGAARPMNSGSIPIKVNRYPFSSRFRTTNMTQIMAGLLKQVCLLSLNKMVNHPVTHFEHYLSQRCHACLHVSVPFLNTQTRFGKALQFSLSFVEEQVSKVRMHNVEELRSSICNAFKKIASQTLTGSSIRKWTRNRLNCACQNLR